jgi:hypothetical protein
MSNNNDHDKVTPEPKRFRKYTSDSESDLDTNNMNNQSISDSKSDALFLIYLFFHLDS